MYGVPCQTPWSRICTTCGLRSAAAAFASRSKRACASGRLAFSPSMNLTAHGISSPRCVACQTEPMPPRPSCLLS